MTKSSEIDLIRQLHENGLECTGCEACRNVCAFSAIEMVSDEYGFLTPEINYNACSACGKCMKACPPVNTNLTNRFDPKAYAVIGPIDERKKSTSGGVFGILATHFLNEGGVVVGASLSQDCMSCSLEIVDNISDLQKLRESKYVQSTAGDVYRDVLRILKEGRKVLFSGLPCQSAAMRNIASDRFENLYLIDLFCASAPSPELYRAYLKEISNGRKIKSVEFRPQRNHGAYSGILTTFEDGSEHYIPDCADPYLRGFSVMLFSKLSCGNCQFQSAPRQGDLSIGDYWGIEKFHPEIDRSEGFSAVLSNSEKGDELLKILRSTCEVADSRYSSVISTNRCAAFKPHHLARQRFIEELYPRLGFEKAVESAVMWQFDVALCSNWRVMNYGGELNNFALFTAIKNLGFSPLLVCPPKVVRTVAIPVPMTFRQTPYPWYNVSANHESYDDIEELNKRIRTFMVGSDQVWNHRFKYLGMRARDGRHYSLSFVWPENKRVSYSTSFGSVKFMGGPVNKYLFNKEIRKFDSISVRESEGVEILKQDFGCNSYHACDPVFLIDRQEYINLSERSWLKFNRKTTFFYFIWPDVGNVSVENVISICSKTETTQFCVSNFEDPAERSSKSRFPFQPNICSEDWLKALIESEYVVTDSFHAVCFSIIFNKKFVFVKSEKATMENGLNRLTNILGKAGLMDRFVDGIENPELVNILETDIDFAAVRRRLEPWIQESKDWLKNAIEESK